MTARKRHARYSPRHEDGTTDGDGPRQRLPRARRRAPATPRHDVAVGVRQPPPVTPCPGATPRTGNAQARRRRNRRAGGDRLGLGLPAIDFVGQLAKFHGRLRPAAALGHQLIELAAKLLALRDQRANLRFLFRRVEQPQPRAVQHVDHIVQRDAIQAGREPVEPLGGGRVAERAELLHFAQADGEDVVVRRLVDVLERFAQQAVALLFAVGA